MSRYNPVTHAIIALICLILLGAVPSDLSAEMPNGFEPAGKPKLFVKNDLYGHINGGAELFHEFGFNQLSVHEYINGEYQIDVELYEMTDPKASMGIYLMKSGEENLVEGIDARCSGSKWQYTIVKGNYFILVNSYTGDESLMTAMTDLVNHHLDTIKPAPKISLFEILPREGLVEGSELLFCGPYSLQSIFTFGAGDILNLNSEVYGVCADYQYSADTLFTRLLIPYPDDKSASQSYSKLQKNLDQYLEVVENRENGFDFKDYLDKYGRVRLDEKLIDIMINLPEKP